MIINFGSINIDHVYTVKNMPAPGETITAKSSQKFLGGKGINQSISISKSKGYVRHVGAVGRDGRWALQSLEAAGIDPSYIKKTDGVTGHAIITVDAAGENQIIIVGGANRSFTTGMIEAALNDAGPGDWVLFQNETNLTSKIAEHAKNRDIKTAFSAAPFVAGDVLPLLDKVNLLAVNEIEAKAIADTLGCTIKEIPVQTLLVTKGAEGAVFYSEGTVIEHPAYPVTPVDTTGAGDTFLGAFLALYCEGKTPKQALHYASAAAALQVTRPGAADAIPSHDEVNAFLRQGETT